MKRKLNKEELAICEKSMKRFADELSWINYQLKYHDLMIDFGAFENYKKNLRDFKQHRVDWENMKKELMANIEVLKYQIENGVEFKKEIKEQKKEGNKNE